MHSRNLQRLSSYLPSDIQQYNQILSDDGCQIFAFFSKDIACSMKDSFYFDDQRVPNLTAIGMFRSSDSIWIDDSENLYVMYAVDDPFILDACNVKLTSFLDRIDLRDPTLEESVYL